MSPLAILFVIFAGIGLAIALLGWAAKWSSPAPSMYQDEIGGYGLMIFIVCGLIAIAAVLS